MGAIDSLHDAWAEHREVPFRFSEIWTHAGRLRHVARWKAFRTERTRQAAASLGVRLPPSWSTEQILRTYSVLTEHCYDVPGFVPDGGVVVDIGMSVGDFAVLSAVRGAMVYAFEPLGENVAVAEQLVRVNHVEERVRISPVALGDAPGSAPVAVDHGMATTGRPGSDRTVPFERLDTVLRELHGPVSILKIDVEGFEIPVLRGARETIARSRPKIVIEVHGKVADRAVTVFLTSLGYRLEASGPKNRASDFGYIRNDFWTPSGERAPSPRPDGSRP